MYIYIYVYAVKLYKRVYKSQTTAGMGPSSLVTWASRSAKWPSVVNGDITNSRHQAWESKW